MPQLPNLRLLFSSSAANHHTSPFFLSPLRIPSPLSLIFKPNKTHQTHKPFSIFASSSYKKQRYRSKPSSPLRRNNTSLRESEKKREGLAMGEDESVGFNRKRAEGRDKDNRKTLQLKVRKLNPVNTICYVQVIFLLLLVLHVVAFWSCKLTFSFCLIEFIKIDLWQCYTYWLILFC